MNHALFCVIFRVRAISALLTPFLQLQTIQKAVIHLSIPRGESSKMELSSLLPLPTFALVMLCVLTMLAPAPGQAQTFQVLHNFTGGTDGVDPYGGLAINARGHIYGTTYGPEGCIASCGTVYEMSRQGSGWIFATLYEFPGGVNGARPSSPVTIATDGSLYGTTSDGGLIYGCYGSGCGPLWC
jgi:hypothetical protein